MAGGVVVKTTKSTFDVLFDDNDTMQDLDPNDVWFCVLPKTLVSRRSGCSGGCGGKGAADAGDVDTVNAAAANTEAVAAIANAGGGSGGSSGSESTVATGEVDSAVESAP